MADSAGTWPPDRSGRRRRRPLPGGIAAGAALATAAAVAWLPVNVLGPAAWRESGRGRSRCRPTSLNSPPPCPTPATPALPSAPPTPCAAVAAGPAGEIVVRIAPVVRRRRPAAGALAAVAAGPAGAAGGDVRRERHAGRVCQGRAAAVEDPAALAVAAIAATAARCRRRPPRLAAGLARGGRCRPSPPLPLPPVRRPASAAGGAVARDGAAQSPSGSAAKVEQAAALARAASAAGAPVAAVPWPPAGEKPSMVLRPLLPPGPPVQAAAAAAADRLVGRERRALDGQRRAGRVEDPAASGAARAAAAAEAPAPRAPGAPVSPPGAAIPIPPRRCRRRRRSPGSRRQWPSSGSATRPR